MAVKPIQDGYHEVTPFIVAEGAAEFLEFLKRAFNVQERMRIPLPDGKVGHAEVMVGESVIMVADPSATEKPAPACIHLYVEDADRVFQQALAAGASAESEPEDHFYGDRSGVVNDKWGNRWFIATHVEDVPPEEVMKRMQALPQT
jgi:PhnB protein